MPDSADVLVPAPSAGVPVVGVGRRACPRTLCLASTITVWIFVPPRSTPPRLAMLVSLPSRWRASSVQQLLDEVEVLHEAAHGEELVADARLRREADAVRALGVLQQPARGRAVGL